MINQRKDIINAISTAITVVFFLIIFSSFSDKPVGQTRCELISEFHYNQVNAVIVDAIPLASFQKNCVPLLHNLFIENHKTIAGNKKIAQSIIVLQRARLLIKPIIPCRFYYHLFPQDAEDLPVLS